MGFCDFVGGKSLKDVRAKRIGVEDSGAKEDVVFDVILEKSESCTS